MKSIKRIFFVVCFTVLGLFCFNQPTVQAAEPEFNYDTVYQSKDKMYEGYISKDGTCFCIKRYKGFALENNTKLVIPSAIDGMTVTALGQNTDTFSQDEIDSESKLISSYFFEPDVEVKEIVIPDTVTIIGPKTFAFTDSLQTVTLSKKTTSIMDYAFYRTKLQSIELPDTVTTIGKYAFSKTEVLTVSFSKNIKTIMEGAFSESRLFNVTLPEGLTTIGDGAFYFCSNLAKVTIPSTVSEIGGGVFAADRKVELIVSDKNQSFKMKNDIMYSKDGTVLVSANVSPGAVYIDPAVTTIGNGAFRNSEVTKVMIQGTVKTIGDYAFAGCGNLESVTLQEGTENLGKYAFTRTDIVSLKLPGSISKIDDYAFFHCENLEIITLNEGLKEIGNGAFALSHIKKVDFPKSTLKIGSQSFLSCDLEKIDLKNIKSIGTGAFALTKISQIKFGKLTSIPDGGFSWMNYLKKITIPSTIKTIGKEAFAHCGLISVKIPKSIKQIQAGAFMDNKNLKSISVDKKNKYYKSVGRGIYSKNGKTLIAVYSTGKTYVVPEKVRYLQAGFLINPTKINKITISKSVKKVASGCFDYSKNSLKFYDRINQLGGNSIDVQNYYNQAFDDTSLWELNKVQKIIFKGKKPPKYDKSEKASVGLSKTSYTVPKGTLKKYLKEFPFENKKNWKAAKK